MSPRLAPLPVLVLAGCFAPTGTTDPDTTADTADSSGTAAATAGSTSTSSTGPAPTSTTDPATGETGTTADPTTGPPAVCGDGTVTPPVEECDDANATQRDGCHDCMLESRLVFITDDMFAGTAIQGGADGLCQNAAGMQYPGRTFVAWLAFNNETAGQNIGSWSGRYERTDGGIVATGSADLLDGELDLPIDHNVLGMPVPTADDHVGCTPGNYVWTGAHPTGDNDLNCKNWTDSIDMATVGNHASTVASWTEACDVTCDNVARLYCFETS